MRAAVRVLLLASWLTLSLVARADVAVPPLTAHVTDLTGTLTAEQAQTLEQVLQAFEARKGSQLAVLIVPTTEPETIEQYGIRVADQWKLGRKNVDDGAILIVAKNDPAVRIEVGYGLEGALTDVTSFRIIREIITPRFRDGDFYGGISAGLDAMMRVVNGEPLPPPAPSPAPRKPLGSFAPILLLIVVIFGTFTRSTLGRFPGAVVTGGVLSLLVWLFAGLLGIAVLAGLIGFLFTLLGGGMGRMGGWGGGFGGWGGGFGGGFSGGFGGGGFGGGGFSGGGGGFGGGGASGTW